MRVYSPTEMVALLPATPKAECAAIEKLTPLHQQFGGDAARLRKLTEQGFLRTAALNVDGQESMIVWYRLLGSHLIVEMVASLKPVGLETMVNGFELIAKTLNCDYVEGMTSSKGLAEFYLAKGYTLNGVHFAGKVPQQ